MIDRPTLKALVTALVYERKSGEYISTAVRNAEHTAGIIMNTYDHDVSAIAGLQGRHHEPNTSS